MGNIQAYARELRYRLMADWCCDNGFSVLLVAHTAEDVAENVLLRLVRGSGVDGLAAMQEAQVMHGVRVVRPLLDIPKDALRDYLKNAGQMWIEDPSNASDAYSRNRMRRIMSALESEGLSVERLCRTARHAARAREALDTYTQEWLQRCVTFYPQGYAELARDVWLGAPEDIRLRVLLALLRVIGCATYKPRFEKLERLHDAIYGGDFITVPLEGCLFEQSRRKVDSGKVLVMREPSAVAADVVLALGENVVWDRFAVQLVPSSWNLHSNYSGFSCRKKDPAVKPQDDEEKLIESLCVGALGEAGWRQIKSRCAKTSRRYPAMVLYTLPALKVLEEVVEVPHIGFCAREDRVCRLTADFKSTSFSFMRRGRVYS